MTFGTTLPHLPTTWSFKESWASNVTAGVAVMSSVVGSTDVVKTFLGEGAEAVTAAPISRRGYQGRGREGCA
jgi:hypothetical protein